MKSTVGIERLVADRVRESAAGKQALLWNEEVRMFVVEVSRATVESLRRSETLFLLGNDGSAGDSRDLPAGLTGRCLRERQSPAGLRRV